jgi:hypothetical protein
MAKTKSMVLADSMGLEFLGPFAVWLENSLFALLLTPRTNPNHSHFLCIGIAESCEVE